MKYMLIALAIIAIALSFTFAKQGDYGIYGTVYKGEGPEGLGNATVEVIGVGSTFTSSSPKKLGFYEISVPEPGGYTIITWKDEGDTTWQSFEVYQTVYAWNLCNIVTHPVVE